MLNWTLIEPQWLWLMPAALVLIGLRFWEDARRRRDRRRFAEPGLFAVMNPHLVAAERREGLRRLLWTIGLVLLVLTLARPGGDPKVVEEQIKKTGVDIMLALDLSASMKAEDIAPNRFAAAREAIRDFIGGLDGDRVGLVVFAGSVSLLAPLTMDYRTLRMFLDVIRPGYLPVDGTAIGEALQTALERIGPESRSKAVIILLTDGENTRGAPPLESAQKAKAAKTRVYTIGLGTVEGSRIPDGVDERGQTKFRQYHGEPVVTRLDETTLQTIADETQGKYFPVRSGDALHQAYAEISRLTQQTHSEKRVKLEYQEHFLWTLLPALWLLLADLLLGLPTSVWRAQP